MLFQCCVSVFDADQTLKQHFGECLVSSGMVHVPDEVSQPVFHPTLSSRLCLNVGPT